MRRRSPRAIDPATLIRMGLLVLGVLTAIGIGLLIVEKIRKAMAGRQEKDEARDPLLVFRKSFQRGEMDEAEYRRITASLTPGQRASSAPEKPGAPKDWPGPPDPQQAGTAPGEPDGRGVLRTPDAAGNSPEPD